MIADVERYAYELSGISSNKATIKIVRAGTNPKRRSGSEISCALIGMGCWGKPGVCQWGGTP